MVIIVPTSFFCSCLAYIVLRPLLIVPLSCLGTELCSGSSSCESPALFLTSYHALSVTIDRVSAILLQAPTPCLRLDHLILRLE